MTSKSGRRRTSQGEPTAGQPNDFAVHVSWEAGPPTDAWIQLWRRIFDDLAQDSLYRSQARDDQCEERS
jgi:hypothetical protein